MVAHFSNCQALSFICLPAIRPLKSHPKAWVPPLRLGFSFYLFPFLERIKCFLSNAQAGKAEGKRLSLLRHAPEGLRKVQAANNAGGIVANRLATTVEIPKAPTYPKYDIEAKYEIFDATTDFRTLVVLPGHPLGS